MKIIQWNSGNTLTQNIHEHIHTFTENETTAILLQEQGKNMKCPAPYISYQNSNTSILVLKTLIHARIPHLCEENENYSTTAIALQKFENTSPLILISTYRPPGTPLHPLLLYLEKLKTITENDIIIGGDFNIHLKEIGSNKTTKDGKNFSNFIKANEKMKILNNGEVTRVGWPGSTSQHAPSAIDLTIFIGNKTSTSWSWTTGEQFTSDHKQIHITSEEQTHNQNTQNFTRYSFIHKNWTTENKQIFYTSLQSKIGNFKYSDPVHDQAEKLTDMIQKSAIESKIMRIYQQPKPRKQQINQYGWSEECNSLLATKKVLEKQLIDSKHSQNHLRDTIKRERNRIAKQIRKTVIANKSKAWAEICSELNHTTPAKKLWEIFHTLGKTKQRKQGGIILLKSGLPTNNVAQIMKNTWKETFDCSNDNIDEAEEEEELNEESYHKEITEIEVTKTLQTMRNTTPGIDGIPTCLLQHIIDIIMKPLLQIFNNSLKTATFPACWKTAIMIPVPKTATSITQDQYRPISLLTTMSKLFEGIIKSRIEYHVYKKDILSEAQFGFRKGRSAPDQILRLVQTTYDMWNEKKDCVLITIDITKAFDTIDHKT